MSLIIHSFLDMVSFSSLTIFVIVDLKSLSSKSYFHVCLSHNFFLKTGHFK